jgi:hypothetical protein
MNKRLEKAIAKARKLPEEIQDFAAARLMECFDEASSDSDRVSIEQARDAYDAGDFALLATWRRQMGIID